MSPLVLSVCQLWLLVVKVDSRCRNAAKAVVRVRMQTVITTLQKHMKSPRHLERRGSKRRSSGEAVYDARM